MAGQIIKRGDSWLVRIHLGRDSNGKRKYFNRTIRGTKKEAQTYLTAKLREKDLGVFIEPASMHLEDFLDKWLDEIVSHRVREATYKDYQGILKRYIKGEIGRRRLSDVQSYEIQTIYNKMKRSGLSSRSVRYTHVVLSSAFKQAIKWRMLNLNPCDHCELPRMEKSEMKYLSPRETAQFLESAKSSKYYVLFLLIIETGMRPEEYLALKWQDLNRENKCITVQRAVSEKGSSSFEFTELKTKKSRRSIPLSDSLLNALIVHRKEQLEYRLKLGEVFQNFDLIFASDSGTPIQQNNLRKRHFKTILKKAMLPEMRLYDLRHTTATLLLSAGENPKVVQERLGHASVVLTLDTYSHVLPSMQVEATKRIEKLMFGT